MRRKAIKQPPIPAMPLIDFFAAMALQGMMHQPGTWWTMDKSGTKHYASTVSEYAYLAYQFAEAMAEEHRSRFDGGDNGSVG